MHFGENEIHRPLAFLVGYYSGPGDHSVRPSVVRNPGLWAFLLSTDTALSRRFIAKRFCGQFCYELVTHVEFCRPAEPRIQDTQHTILNTYI